MTTRWFGEQGAIAGCIAAGTAERLAWAFLKPGVAHAEAASIAIALADGRGFADAFLPGQGPTAHVMPISPLLAAGVYRLLGVRTLPAETVLATWSIALALGSYLLFYRAFGRLGVPVWARLCVLVFLCVVPIYIGQEVVDFRIWEGGLTVFLVALFLDRLLAHLDAPGGGWRPIIGFALLNALIFFVNPMVGIGCYACSLLMLMRTSPPRRWLPAAGLATMALAIFVGPWTLRNQISLGRPIPLRSNGGLELALAMHPGALDSSADPTSVMEKRLSALHPIGSPRNFRRMKDAGGEAAYADRLGAAAFAWMRTHPAAAIRIALRHLTEIYAPRAWQFHIAARGAGAGVKAAGATLAGVFGLIGIIVALVRRRRHWIYPALMATIPALLFAPFQPVPRYTYLLYALLAFCAASLAGFREPNRQDKPVA